MAQELNALEEQFFATGELPAELQAQATPPAAPAPTETPPATLPAGAVVEPAPNTTPDPTADLRLQLEASRRQQQQIESRLAQLAEHLTKPPAPAPEQAPDPTTDPLGAMMHELNALNKRMTELQNGIVQQQQVQTQQQTFNQFVEQISAVKQAFIKDHPDFDAAYKHLVSVRSADLRDMGVPEDQIKAAMVEGEIAIALNAQNAGRNPAQAIYDMAKRYGYRAAPPSDPAGKLAQLARGAEAANIPPRAGADMPLTHEGLREAGDDDLNKLVQDDGLWSKMVGNRSNDIF